MLGVGEAYAGHGIAKSTPRGSESVSDATSLNSGRRGEFARSDASDRMPDRIRRPAETAGDEKLNHEQPVRAWR